ncbi:MAG: dihydrofolate reductase [Deltaproteobacteria bacterium]|nr:dihydrofolate reductase [Deltaproteobacteria bacterium]
MITIVAAVARNGCIGKDGALPWRIPEDMKRYRAITMGKVVVMGRRTWESIPERFRPLPGRTNVVVTRRIDYPLPVGVERFASLADALAAHAGDEVVVNGGGAVYAEAMARADVLDLTHVHRDVAGDTFFPPIDPAVWKETAREDREELSFVTYRRR